MKKIYNSKYYSFPIEVENIGGEILIKIFTEKKEEIIYSWYDIKEKTSYSPYIKNTILASFIGKIPKNILIIGFGGGSYAKYLCDYLGKKINITGIEIDKAMIEIAKKEYNLNSINYINSDFIKGIENLEKNFFDIIFIDIYDKNSSIPNSLYIETNIKNIIKLLEKNGKLLINYANYLKNEKNYLNLEKLFFKNLENKEYIKILNNKNDYGNIIGVYNLKKNISSKELILEYLQKVKNGIINYDSNLIKNIYIK